MKHVFRAVVAAAAGVAAVVILPTDADANTAVRDAEVTSVELVAGYRIVYEGVAVQVTQLDTGVTGGQCAFQLAAEPPPVVISPECWFEYADGTGIVGHLGYRIESPMSAAAVGSPDTRNDRQLRFCIQVTVRVPGTTEIGPAKCALVD